MLKKISYLSTLVLIPSIVFADKLESIFIVPDVFVTSKLKPTTEYESERGNILFEGHDIEKKKKIFYWWNVKSCLLYTSDAADDQ